VFKLNIHTKGFHFLFLRLSSYKCSPNACNELYFVGAADKFQTIALFGLRRHDGLGHPRLSSLPNAVSLFVGLHFHENVQRWSSEPYYLFSPCQYVLIFAEAL
jgi:hypothetical protein